MPGKRVTIQGVRRLPDEPMVEPSCEDAMGKGATRSRHPESESISRKHGLAEGPMSQRGEANAGMVSGLSHRS